MTTYKTNDDPKSLKVGDIFKGIQCHYPYLDAVGDTGIWCNKEEKHLARYIVVNVVCNKETNEAITMDLQLIESLDLVVKQNPDALCFLHSKEIPCADCLALIENNYP